MFGPLRIRHAYAKLETSVIDVIAGRDVRRVRLGRAFYPATVGYLGVPGRDLPPQSAAARCKVINAGSLEVTAAIAAMRPAQRDSGAFPDGQAGLKAGLGSWSGRLPGGFGPPQLQPISVGVSGLVRRFEVPEFKAEPGSQHESLNGYGFTAQALLPVIPATSLEDKRNALTLTGEFTIGSKVSPSSTVADGGSRLPVVVDTSMLNPPPAYPQNIDPGFLTFDREMRPRDDQLESVRGRRSVLHLPVGKGRPLAQRRLLARVVRQHQRAHAAGPARAASSRRGGVHRRQPGHRIRRRSAVGLYSSTLKLTFGDLQRPAPNWSNAEQPVGTPGQLPVTLKPTTAPQPRHVHHVFLLLMERGRKPEPDDFPDQPPPPRHAGPPSRAGACRSRCARTGACGGPSRSTLAAASAVLVYGRPVHAYPQNPRLVGGEDPVARQPIIEPAFYDWCTNLLAASGRVDIRLRSATFIDSTSWEPPR